MVIKILKTGAKIVILTAVGIACQVVAGKTGKELAKTINDILN